MTIPKHIGEYAVERELGRGGMGVVYLARDTALDRSVAIKVLPEAVAADAERLARFEREARVLASLNHPNIAAIFGIVGEPNGRARSLVLEYVPGPTLADRLAGGPIPVDEALQIASQVAAGIEAAHDAGVIHRDLKPANVKLTADGQVKVLDFGLAKAAAADAGTVGTGGADSGPTVTTRYTQEGVVLGTAPYMSPEQARGKALDKRTDIWSFGCLVYEMLTGHQPFVGETVSDVIAAILEREPDYAVLPARTPPRVRELLAHCLEKNARLRLRDIGDARIALERSLTAREWSTTALTRAGGMPASVALRPIAHWGLVLALAIFAAMGWLWPRIERTDTTRPESAARTPIFAALNDNTLPARGEHGGNHTLAISPDGSRVAFLGRDASGRNRLYLRELQRPAARVVSGELLDVLEPFFAPDGLEVGFYARGKLYKVHVGGGGAPVALVDLPAPPKGAAWGPDGILLCPASNAGLSVVPAAGGELHSLSVPDPARDEVCHRWPDLLPGGRYVLMTIKTRTLATFDDADIALLDRHSGTWSTLIRGGSYARYCETGHILYARGGALLAVPFDLGTLSVTGPAVTLLEGVLTKPGSGVAQFAAARRVPTLVYVPGGASETMSELVWITRSGAVELIGAPQRTYNSAVGSPDGTRIALGSFGASDAVFVYDIARGNVARATYDGNCANPAWMPDGKRIVYSSDFAGPVALYASPADGSGGAEKVLGAPSSDFEVVPTQPVPTLVYSSAGDILLKPMGAEDPPRPLLASSFVEARPAVSPDGRWIAYQSDESGQTEIYVRPFPAGEGKWQVSLAGGSDPAWSPDGRELFFHASDGGTPAVFSAAVAAEVGGTSSAPSTAASGGDVGAIRTATPVKLFDRPPRVSVGPPTRDGQRFLGLRALDPPFKADQVLAVLNWDVELAQRASARTASP